MVHSPSNKFQLGGGAEGPFVGRKRKEGGGGKKNGARLGRKTIGSLGMDVDGGYDSRLDCNPGVKKKKGQKPYRIRSIYHDDKPSLIS